MAKKDYDDMSELLRDLEDDVTNSILIGSVNKVVKEAYRKNVDEMYNAYEPTYYIRREYNDGFRDEDNLEEDVTVVGNSFEYTLTNETKPVNDKNYRLDDIIEEGIYDYGNIPARPVYEWTQEELDNGDLVEKALEKDLKGW